LEANLPPHDPYTTPKIKKGFQVEYPESSMNNGFGAGFEPSTFRI